MDVITICININEQLNNRKTDNSFDGKNNKNGTRTKKTTELPIR